MTIVVVISSYFPRWGGAERQAQRQAAELARRGHRVDVVTWRHDPNWPETENVDGVTVHRVGRSDPSTLGNVRSFVSMVRTLVAVALHADVIVAHQLLFTTYLAATVAVLTRTPVVAKATTTSTVAWNARPLAQGGPDAWLRRAASVPLRRWGIAVAMTGEIERGLRHLGFQRVVRIPNGAVDPVRRSRDQMRCDLTAEVGASAEPKIVVASGRLVHSKGFDVLLSAWTEVARLGANPLLLIVGSGPEEESLRQQARDLGINESVRFIAATDGAADYLACADAVVIPSDFEGMSNVLLEAMVAGVPVVATRVSGAVDLIRDGENGRLVPTRDPRALAAAVIDVLTDPGTLGPRARETVLEQCGMSHVVDLYERVFAHAPELPRGVVGTEQLAQYPLDESIRGMPCVESAG